MQYNFDGSVDITLNHPIHGNIPFTASPNDPDPDGQKVWADVVAGVYGTISPYPNASKLSDAKASKIAEVTQSYTQLSTTNTVTVGGNIFQADPGSQSRLNNTLTSLAGANPPAGFYWLDSTNNKVPMTTNADLVAIATAMLTQGFADFDRLQTAKLAINAITGTTQADIDAVNAITF